MCRSKVLLEARAWNINKETKWHVVYISLLLFNVWGELCYCGCAIFLVSSFVYAILKYQVNPMLWTWMFLHHSIIVSDSQQESLFRNLIVFCQFVNAIQKYDLTYDRCSKTSVNRKRFGTFLWYVFWLEIFYSYLNQLVSKSPFRNIFCHFLLE